MATFLDPTYPIHLNASSDINQGYRQYNWSKVCPVGSWTNIMSFQITSAPSTTRGFHIIVNSCGWKWDGDNLINSECWGQETFWYYNITTSSTWSFVTATTKWEGGNGIGGYDVTNSGAYIYIRGNAYFSNMVVGVSIRALTSNWNNLAVNYY